MKKKYSPNPYIILFICCCCTLYILFTFNQQEQKFLSNSLDLSLYPNQTFYQDLNKLPPSLLNMTNPNVSKESELIVIVVTRNCEVERRNEIRRSWDEKSIQRQKGRVSVIFLVNSDPENNTSLLEEQSKYGDLLMVNLQDNYRNLVFKCFIAFRWISHHFPNAHVAKIDSDVVVDLDKLVRALDAQEGRVWMVGFIYHKVRPIRDSANRWFVPESSFAEEFYPSYCNGPLYVISSLALRRILQNASSVKVFQVEDAFFTGVLAERAGVPRRVQPGILKGKPYSQFCGPGEIPTIIGYPAHLSNLTTTVKMEEFGKIPCKTWLQRLLYPIID